MSDRDEYFLDFSSFDQSKPPSNITDIEFKPARLSDTHALAVLMIEAYRGTIEYDDEIVEDALIEVQSCRRAPWPAIYG